MDLTAKNKECIDNKSYESLLLHYRNAPAGNPWFQGETGRYWRERMTELRKLPGGNAIHIAASKSIGWD